MDETNKIRNLCIQEIKKEYASNGVTVVELNGNHFAGADIALKEKSDIGLYRVTVIRHQQERRFK